MKRAPVMNECKVGEYWRYISTDCESYTIRITRARGTDVHGLNLTTGQEAVNYTVMSDPKDWIKVSQPCARCGRDFYDESDYLCNLCQ